MGVYHLTKINQNLMVILPPPPPKTPYRDCSPFRNFVATGDNKYMKISKIHDRWDILFKQCGETLVLVKADLSCNLFNFSGSQLIPGSSSRPSKV